MPALTRTKYEADDGTIHPIRMTAAYAEKAGTPPTGAVNSDIRVKISKGNREYGLRPRRVGLGRVLGTAPDTFSKSASLAVLTPAAFASAAFAIDAKITIDGNEWTVISRAGEDY